MSLPDPSPESIVLVTGASSGIGEEFARQLSQVGHRVALVARREERLRELAEELGGDERAVVLGADLASPEDRDRLAGRIDELGAQVDILVNNAGFGIYEDFARSDRERELQQARVGVEAVVDLSSRYVPGMVERGTGAVINTASTAGFQPIPGNATYSAAKAFVLTFSEALSEELRGTGVTVTAVCPGPVHTGFQDASEAHDFAATLPKPLWKPPEEVVAAALDAADSGKRRVVPGIGNRILGWSGRHTPRAVLLRVLRAQGS
jgi:uncharacterized protein